jgi:hypothetical protein
LRVAPVPLTVASVVVATEVLLLLVTVTASAPASAPLCATVTFTVGSPVAPTAPDRYVADRDRLGVP